MKRSLKLATAIASLLSVSSVHAICPFPPDLTPPDPSASGWIGGGIDLDRGERPKPAMCGNGVVVDNGSPEGVLTATLHTTYGEINTATGRSKNGKVGISVFGIGGSFGKSREFMQKITQKSYSQSFVVQYDMNTGGKRFDINPSDPLNDLADRVKGDVCDFRRICGTHFVSQTTEGAKVFLGIQFSFSSQSYYEEFKRTTSAGISADIKGKIPISFSGDLSKSTSSMSSSLLKNGHVSVFIHQLGGDVTLLGRALLGTDGSTSLTCSLEQPNRCLQAVDHVMAYLASQDFIDGIKQSPAVISYHLNSYWEMDPDVPDLPSELNEDILNARERLAAELDQRIENKNKLEELLQRINLSSARWEQLSFLLKALEEETEKLSQAGLVCFSDLANCADNAKQVLAGLRAYGINFLELNPSEGLIVFYPFDDSSRSTKVITNSYPYAARLYGDAFYQNPWYAPAPERIYKDKPILTHFNIASSLTIFPGCTLVLYGAVNYGGLAVPLVMNYPNLALIHLNDNADSARLICPATNETTFDSAGKIGGAVYGASPVEDRYGNANSAYHFGGGKIIDIPGDLSVPRLTLSAWVKPDTHNDGLIIGRTSDNWDAQYALVQQGNSLYFYIRRTNNCANGSGWYAVNAGTLLPLHEWSLVTGTWDGNTLQVYVNGELKGIRHDIPAGGITECNSSSSTRLGFWFDQDVKFFAGSIDDIYFYDRALSQTEIQRQFTAIAPDTNLAPLASFTTTAAQGSAPLSLTVDAGLSSDTDGSIVSYTWEVTEMVYEKPVLRETASGQTTTFTLDQPGEYIISLLVEDDQGATSLAQKTIFVEENNGGGIGDKILSVFPQSGGTVFGTGINCGTDCDEIYSAASSVMLGAVPAAGYQFKEWGMDCDHASDDVCNLVMDTDKAVYAVFEPEGTSGLQTLTVQVQGSGSVSATGITCGLNGTDCSEDYVQGTQITLTASPDKDYEFIGWSGGACSGTGECVVEMNANAVVTATFEQTGNTSGVCRIVNISTRANVSGGQHDIFAGFVLTGVGTQQIMLRGIAAGSGVNPSLILLRRNGLDWETIKTNDEWELDSEADSVRNLAQSLRLPDTYGNDAGALLELPANVYSVQLSSNGGSGLAVVGVDAINTTGPILANISTRAYISGGENDAFAGFIIGGDSNCTPLPVMLRGIAVDTTVDPKLTLLKRHGTAWETVKTNDEWETDGNASVVSNLPTNLRLPDTYGNDAGILLELGPGVYSLQLTSTSGPGLAVVGVDAVQ